MALIIDGSNLCHRALESGRDGGEYNYREALKKCLSILYKLSNYNYLLGGMVVAFDHGVPVHRRKLLETYKPDKEILKINSSYILDQIKETESENSFDEEYKKLTDFLCRKLLPKLGCIAMRVENCEADDIIAHWIYYSTSEDRIVSTDRDLLQLLGPNTTAYDPIANKHFDLETMEEKGFHIPLFRKHYLLNKSILGDKSDNIPGVAGIGDRTVIEYSKQVTLKLESGLTLAESLNNLERVGSGSKKGLENLSQSSNLIKRNMALMDLYLPLISKMEISKEIKKTFRFYLEPQNNSLLVDEILFEMDIASPIEVDALYEYNVSSTNELIETVKKII